jgi:hypothetical protein
MTDAEMLALYDREMRIKVTNTPYKWAGEGS